MKLQDFQAPPAAPTAVQAPSKMEEIRRKARAAKQPAVPEPICPEDSEAELPTGFGSGAPERETAEAFPQAQTENDFVAPPAPRARRRPGSNASSDDSKTLEDIPVGLLRHYPAHPFKLYDGKRLAEMVQSIQDAGVMNPIIVAQEQDGYTILSGHNRTEAAKLAGLATVPALVHHGLSEAEKKLIVVESNLHQRAVSEMTPTEKGYAYKMELEALKELGKNSEKVNNYSTFQQAENADAMRVDEKDCACAIGGKITDTIAENHETTYDEIYRYIRLTFLIAALQQRVDSEAIGLTVAVPLSYISHPLQKQIHAQLEVGKQLDREKAELLKRYAKQKKLSDETIRQILNGELSGVTVKSKDFSISLKGKVLKSYFPPDMGKREMNNQIVNSLELTQKKIPSLLQQHGEDEGGADMEKIVQRALDFYFELKGK